MPLGAILALVFSALPARAITVTPYLVAPSVNLSTVNTQIALLSQSTAALAVSTGALSLSTVSLQVQINAITASSGVFASSGVNADLTRLKNVRAIDAPLTVTGGSLTVHGDGLFVGTVTASTFNAVGSAYRMNGVTVIDSARVVTASGVVISTGGLTFADGTFQNSAATPFSTASLTAQFDAIAQSTTALSASTASLASGLATTSATFAAQFVSVGASTAALAVSTGALSASTSSLQAQVNALGASTSSFASQFAAVGASTAALAASTTALSASTASLASSLATTSATFAAQFVSVGASTAALAVSTGALSASTSSLQAQINSITASTGVFASSGINADIFRFKSSMTFERQNIYLASSSYLGASAYMGSNFNLVVSSAGMVGQTAHTSGGIADLNVMGANQPNAGAAQAINIQAGRNTSGSVYNDGSISINQGTSSQSCFPTDQSGVLITGENNANGSGARITVNTAGWGVPGCVGGGSGGPSGSINLYPGSIGDGTAGRNVVMSSGTLVVTTTATIRGDRFSVEKSTFHILGSSVGVRTSTPRAALDVRDGLLADSVGVSTASPQYLFTVGDSTWGATVDGWTVASGSMSVTQLSGCGTGATFTARSGNSHGKVNVQNTGATSCVIAFKTSAPNGIAPDCSCQNETTANLCRATPTTAQVTLAVTTITGDVVSYRCLAF